MCGIWNWQSTIVEDLNNSQDPKHTLFCRENAFVAIYALFQTTNVPFLPVKGGGLLFFTVFFIAGLPLGPLLVNMIKAYCPLSCLEKSLDKLVREDELISREASLHLDAEAVAL